MKPEAHQYSHPTLVAIAVLGFLVACVAHEVVGHGGMSLALGDRVDLLPPSISAARPAVRSLPRRVPS